MIIDPNTAALVAIAAFQMVGAFFTWRTHETTKDTNKVASETKAIALVTEKNTNSLTTALVAATKEAAHSAGHEEGRLQAEATASAVAEGVAAAYREPTA